MERVNLKTIAHLDLIILAKTSHRGHNKKTFSQKWSKMQSSKIKTLFKHVEKRTCLNKIMKIFLKFGWRVRSIHQSYQDSSFQKGHRVQSLKVKMRKKCRKDNKIQVLRKMFSQIILLAQIHRTISPKIMATNQTSSILSKKALIFLENQQSHRS